MCLVRNGLTHFLHTVDVGPGLDSTSPDFIRRRDIVSGSLHPLAKNTSVDGPAQSRVLGVASSSPLGVRIVPGEIPVVIVVVVGDHYFRFGGFTSCSV